MRRAGWHAALEMLSLRWFEASSLKLKPSMLKWKVYIAGRRGSNAEASATGPHTQNQLAQLHQGVAAGVPGQPHPGRVCELCHG